MNTLDKYALVITLIVGCSAHAADGYNTQIRLTHSSASGNTGRTSSEDGINIQHYLGVVKFDDSKSFAEAAFLQRVSSISGSIQRTNFETASARYETFAPVAIGATAYHGDYVFGVNLGKYDATARRKANTALGYDLQHSNHALMFGYFVQPNTVVYLTHSKSSTQFSAVGGEQQKSDASSSSNKVSLRKLVQLSTDQYLRVSAGYASTTETNSYSGVVRFYPSKSAYIEYGYTTNYGKNTTSNNHVNTAAIGYELNKQWGVDLGGEVYSSKQTEMNTLRLGAHYKF